MIKLCAAVLGTLLAMPAYAGFVGSYIGAAAGAESAVKKQAPATASAYTTTSKVCHCTEGHATGMCRSETVDVEGRRIGRVEYLTPEQFAISKCGFKTIKQITTIFRHSETRYLIEGE